jgi:hypothetical protein
VSLQIAILKVLSGHRDGRATVAAMNADLKILNTSRDWNERMRRLAARAGAINIFSLNYVSRGPADWQLTGAGLEFLRMIEAPGTLPAPQLERVAPPAPAVRPPERARPAVLIIGRKDRSRRRRRNAA